MEDEVYPLMKFLVETVPFHELYWTGICKQAGLDALTPQSPPHADDYNFQVYDIADALSSIPAMPFWSFSPTSSRQS
jgi:hypothetical protein